MRKLFSCILAVLLLCMTPVLCQQVWAAEGDSGSAGDGVYWSLDNKGTLTVTGTGKIEDNPWLTDYAKVIKKVVVGEGVTELCYNAFYGCSSLMDVTLPSTLRIISDSAFESCTSLKEIVIPEGVTTLEYDAFWYCGNLDSITIPSTLTELGSSSLGGTSSIENVYITSLEQWCALELNRSGVMYDKLYLNGELVTELVIPESITAIPNYHFDGWTTLEKLVVPDHVTQIGQYAFDGCTNLKEVTLGEGITAIQTGVFGDCPNLTKLTIPAGILAINTKVFHCDNWQNTSSLTELCFLGDAPMIASDAFSGVTATVRYSAENDSWTEANRQNYGGTLTWVADPSIPDSGASGGDTVMASGSCGEAITWSLGSKGILTVTGTGKVEKNPWLEDYAKVIKKVVVDEGITELCYNAFYGCSSLMDVTLPSTLRIISDSAFESCTSLKEIVIPEGVTTLEYDAFWYCGNLDSITIPSTLTELGSSSLSGTSSIENVYITSLEQWCALELNRSGVMYDKLYLNGELVTELVIPESITAIPNYHFDGWTTLEKLVVPDHVTQIGQYAFDGCTNLKEVTLGNGITAIQNGVFGDCPNLAKLTLPRSILVVNSKVFHCDNWQNTSSLTELRFMGDAPLIASDAFSGITATVYYSDKNASWTEDVRQNYGGTLTWVATADIPGSDATDELKIAASGSCGEAITWSLDSKGTLAILGTGKVEKNPWLEDYAKVIKKVVVDEGITELCYNAFYGCSSLMDVTLPSTLRIISDSAFESCTSLKEIVIPEGVTTLEYDAFWYCGNLDSITIPSTLTELGSSSLSGTSSIENVYITSLEQWCALELNRSGVMYDKLYLNGELVTELVIPESITAIPNYHFDGWTTLEKLVVPDHVTQIGQYAFDSCTNLKEVTLGEGITAIQTGVFGDCPNLAKLTLPRSVLVVNSKVFHCDNWQNTSSLAELRFMGDAPLIASDAFSGVTVKVYYSAANSSWTEELFQNYGGTITWQADSRIPGTGEEPEVTIIASGVCGGNLYWELNSANVLYIYGGKARASGDGVMEDYATPEDAPWYEYREQIRQVVVEETVTSVGSNAFSACEQLTKVVVQEHVQSIGENAFAGCDNLEDVNFQGDAPTFGDNCFGDQEVLIRYPAENDSWSQDVVASAGTNITLEAHTHDYLHVVVKPTCTKQGYTKHNCICGDSYTDAETEMISHDWSQWEREGSEEKRTCQSCGLEETRAFHNPFVDMFEADYYYDSVLWAVSKDITKGTDATHFAPDGTCTRAQIVTFLWRANGSPKVGSTNPFTDVPADAWYADAVLWAVAEGITSGTSATTFSPDDGCTRGQVATFLWRSEGQPASDGNNIFTDIAYGEYYYDAVLWAVANGITNGVAEGLFAPDAICTRAQIVTFLYRAMA